MKNPILRRLSTLLSLVFCSYLLSANNIQVTNVTIASQDVGNDYYMIEFDVSWENSWRTSTLESNWDAAWVFLKFTALNKHEWQHAYLDATGHVAPPNCVIKPGRTSNGAGLYVGAIIHRDSDFIGNANYQNVQLRWDYGISGLGDNDPVEISVHAIEMVFVPQGMFYVGDGNSLSGFELETSGAPYQVTSEASITMGGGGSGSMGNNNDGDDDYNDATSQTLPVEFPKGFNAFYCMKYEISQGQYTDFLNKLNDVQAINRYPGAYPIAGNTINNPGTIPNKYTVDNPSVACNFLDFSDFMAYMDWSGMRPMTELEFEKACRGPIYPILDEYAWGNNFLSNKVMTYSNPGSDSSMITNMQVNTGHANYNLTTGLTPLRNGIFAASAINKTRQETGATYYGIMEMSGNLWERTIWTGDFAGRQYRALHGDGSLSANGSANENLTIWPLIDNGNGFRGGTYSLPESIMFIANRVWQSGIGVAETRDSKFGGRGVRSDF